MLVCACVPVCACGGCVFVLHASIFVGFVYWVHMKLLSGRPQRGKSQTKGLKLGPLFEGHGYSPTVH